MGKKKTTRKASNRPLEHRPGRVHTSATALILATGKVEVGGHVAIPVLEHNFLRAIDAYRRKYRSTTKEEIVGALRNVLRALEQEAS